MMVLTGGAEKQDANKREKRTWFRKGGNEKISTRFRDKVMEDQFF
jgi:hypothetical protein